MKMIKRQIIELDLNDVEPNESQPRTDSNKDGIAELATNLEYEGLQNLTLVERHPDKPGRYRIISGERRWHSLCYLRDNDRGPRRHEFMLVEGAGKTYLMSVAENTNRKNLNPIEDAWTIRRLRSNEFSMTWEQISDLMGDSVPTLMNRLKLLDFPKEIRDMISRGDLPPVSVLRLSKHRDDKARMLMAAHDLIAGREAPDFHFHETTAHGQKMVEAHMPKTPDEFARRIVRLMGRVSTMPAVVTAFMEMPKSDRAKALESIDISVRGKIRKAVVTMSSSLRILASEMEVELAPGPPRRDESENTAKIPAVSVNEAHFVLSHVIGGSDSSLVVDLSKASLGKKLKMNGDSPEARVIGSFRCLQEHWGLETPRGASAERDFLLFVSKFKRKTGNPKFRRALTIIKGRDKSTDPVNLDMV